MQNPLLPAMAGYTDDDEPIRWYNIMARKAAYPSFSRMEAASYMIRMSESIEITTRIPKKG